MLIAAPFKKTPKDDRSMIQDTEQLLANSVGHWQTPEPLLLVMAAVILLIYLLSGRKGCKN